MDVTPLIPADRQLITAYGDGGFRISGVRHAGSVLVFPGRTEGWAVADAEQITPDSLGGVTAQADVEILLVGCGTRTAMVPGPVRRWLKEAGVVVEAMDTGAACRTYNVLLAEGRRVAAALIAV